MKEIYLLDTNIISEVTKPFPSQNVLTNLEFHQMSCAISSITWFELLKGVSLLQDEKRIDDLYSFSNNKEMFDQAYFQNNPNALKEHFDSYCGDGFYDEMSNAFDVATDNTQTVDAKNEALSKIDSCISQYKCSRYERGDI